MGARRYLVLTLIAATLGIVAQRLQQGGHALLITGGALRVRAALIGGPIPGKLRAVPGHGGCPAQLARFAQAVVGAKRLGVALELGVAKAGIAEGLKAFALFLGKPLGPLGRAGWVVSPTIIATATHGTLPSPGSPPVADP